MNTSITNHVGGYSFEIRDKLKKKRICELNVGLTFAKGHAECKLEAMPCEENGDDVMFMFLKCPIVCVESCQFLITIKLGNIGLYKSGWQRITCCSVSTKLTYFGTQRPLTLLSVNQFIDESLRKRYLTKTKIFFELQLTIRCDPLTPLQRLLCDIAAPELADFTFNVDQEYFPAHKSILSARSPVLARMLSNANYSETQQSLMTINDCTKSTFMLFLNFMYGASIHYISVATTVELLQIADKYEAIALKRICETLLIENITEADPVHYIYEVASQYNCSKELICYAYDLVRRKYFSQIELPEKLSENPNEVRRLVEKMEAFKEILKEINDNLR